MIERRSPGSMHVEFHAASTSPPTVRPLRVWPALVMIGMFWTFLYVHYTYELGMLSRFISRVVAYAMLLVLFLGWWLSRRTVALRDRLAAVGVMLGAALVAGLFAHATVPPLVLFMTALPFVVTAWTLWLLISRPLAPRARRFGHWAVIAATTGVFALVRWDGLYGNQIPQFSWRWSATPEELFLESRKSQPANTSPETQTPALKSWSVTQDDWPAFRGPHRTGVASARTMNLDWTLAPPELLWRQRVGPAWSSMIVVNGYLVTQEQRGEQEAVVCYDAATGKELWVHAHQDRFDEALSGVGPRGTPTFANGRIYSLGGKGRLTCLSPSDGSVLWSKQVVEDAGGAVPQWGYSVSPLVVENKVIVFAGGKDQQGLLALDAASGEPVWSQAGGDMSYSSPQLLELHGQPQVVMHDNHGLRAVRVDDGSTLWHHGTKSEMAMPMLQPQSLIENRVLLATDPGVALLDVKRDGDTWTVHERWSSNRLKPAFNDFVVYENHIYGLDDGILCCIDLESGERRWKRGRYGHGQLLLLAQQGLLLVLCENGEAVLVEANPQVLKELGRLHAIEGKTWNHPAFADGRLFVRNAEEMACYEMQPPGR